MHCRYCTDLVRHIFHPPCALATAGPGSELLQVTEHVLVLGSDHRDPASSSLYLTPSHHCARFASGVVQINKSAHSFCMAATAQVRLLASAGQPHPTPDHQHGDTGTMIFICHDIFVAFMIYGKYRQIKPLSWLLI